MRTGISSAMALACVLPWLAEASRPLADEAPIGFEVASPAEACAELSGAERAGEAPLPVIVSVTPEALREPGYLDPLLACAPDRRLAPVVRLEPPLDWQRAPDPYAAVAEWFTDLDRFLVEVRGRVHRYQLGRRPETQLEPDAYAYLIEKVSTLLRSLDPKASLAPGAIGQDAETWLDRIDPRRLDPYVDRLFLEDPVDLSFWVTRLAGDYPARRVWLQTGGQEADAVGLLRRFHEARAAGVECVVFPYAAGRPDAAILLNLVQALPGRFVPDREGSAPAAAGEAGSLLRFVDTLGPERATVVLAPGGAAVAVGDVPVSGARGVDLATGASVEVAVLPPSHDGGQTILTLPSGGMGPVLLRYVALKGPRGGEPETVGVTDQYEMSAEEIIARNRAFEAAQSRRLEHYEARATVAYHYRAETLGESIGVVSVNRFFWKQNVGEYQELDLYVNGARWRGKPPNLPFIQAEKVKEVPLEMRLDQSYNYELEGREEVRGRQAYRVGFEPIEEGRSLYSGQVWVDFETFARLKIRLVQHALKEPITSNSDTIEYEPVPGCGDGCWLPVRADRQMVFTVLGRAVAVERRVTYEQFAVNSPLFEQGREQAYASGQAILRDDETGYSFLVKTEDGMRVRKAESLLNVAFFGGIGVNSSGNLGTPFAGVNYFDFNWRNTGTQFDLAFAGPVVGLVWTDPALGKSRWELTLDGRFAGIAESFHRTTVDGRVDSEDLDALEQRALVVLSRPITPFQKAVLQTEAIWTDYKLDAPDDPNVPEFVPPPAGAVGAATARWNYHRRGYLLDLWYSAGHRFEWSDWGTPAPSGSSGGAVLTGGSSEDVDFRRWGLTALKSFYPTKLQEFSLGLSLFDGAGLDRFSRFRIGDFRNARVSGFNSKDITFDRGATGQVTYKFTLPRGGVSMELGLEGAAIDNDQDMGERVYLAGGRSAVSFSGPWGTLISARISFGLGSSVDLDVHGVSGRLIMIKTMDHWPRRRRAQ